MISSLAERVLKVTQGIPKGRVSTYKEIAKKLGNEDLARVVDNALRKNPRAPIISCHRVIRSDVEIGGYVFGIQKKTSLLKSEGVVIRCGKVNLQKFSFFF